MEEDLNRIAYGYLKAFREQTKQEDKDRKFWLAADAILQCRPDMGVALGSEIDKLMHVCGPGCASMSEEQCVRAGWLPPDYKPQDPDVFVCRRRVIHYCSPYVCSSTPACPVSGRVRRKAASSMPKNNHPSSSYAVRRSSALRAALQEDDAEEADVGGGGEEEEEPGGQAMLLDAVDYPEGDGDDATVKESGEKKPGKTAEENHLSEEDPLMAQMELEDVDLGEMGEYGIDDVTDKDDIYAAMDAAAEEEAAEALSMRGMPAAHIHDDEDDDVDEAEEEDDSSVSVSVGDGAYAGAGAGGGGHHQRQRRSFGGSWDIANTSVLGMEAAAATGSSAVRGAFNKLPPQHARLRQKRKRTIASSSSSATRRAAHTTTTASSWSDVDTTAPSAPKRAKQAPTAGSFSMKRTTGGGAGAGRGLYVRPQRTGKTGALARRGALVPAGAVVADAVVGAPGVGTLGVAGAPGGFVPPSVGAPVVAAAAHAPNNTYKKHRMSKTDRALTEEIRGVIRRLFFTADVRLALNAERVAQYNEELNEAYRAEAVRMLRAKQYPNYIVAMTRAKGNVPKLRQYAALEWADSEGPVYVERLRRAWRVAERVGWIRDNSRNLSVAMFVLGMCNMMCVGWRWDVVGGGGGGVGVGGGGGASNHPYISATAPALAATTGYLIRRDAFIGKHLPRSDDLGRFGFERIVCGGEKIIKNMLMWIQMRGAEAELVDALSAAAPAKAVLPTLT